MNVRCVETAGPEETQGHATAGPDESREGFAVRGEEVAPLSAGAAGLVEVEDELGVVEEVVTVWWVLVEIKVGGGGWWGRETDQKPSRRAGDER